MRTLISSRISLYFAFILLLAVVLVPVAVMAQTNISGDITGVVTDPSGAVIANAKVTVTNTATGGVFTATTDSAGVYRTPFLAPGSYKVAITAPGFETTETSLAVSAGVVAQANAKLKVGGSSTMVEISESGPLVNTENAEIETVFSLQQVQGLPNPGNDLTFIAQTAPGSAMNTQGGYGNFSSFGLPATSNSFTINGGYQNDPFLNISNSGATNLLLGNNDIATVTVVSPAYETYFGGLAGAQVAEISRSGGSQYHGDLNYWWNGSVMNANDWFNKNAGQKKPRSNANQWAADLGGPIIKDKLFGFINTEGLRVIIPVRGTMYTPSPTYQSDILLSTPLTNATYTPYGNLATNGNSAESGLYTTIFNYYNHMPGYCSTCLDPSDPKYVTFNTQSSNFAQEWIITGRLDYNLKGDDKLFVHYKQDKGLQPTFTSFVSPLFNAQSPQPSYSGETGYTHSFTPNLVNQFLMTGMYYRAIFTNTNQAAATASVPLIFIPEADDIANNPSGGLIGGEDYAFPQGRNVTGYQFQDDLTYSKGHHTIKAGWAMRRDDVTDYTPSEHQVGEDIILDMGDFAAGLTDEWVQRFPQRLTQPVALYVMDAYAQDAWKLRPNLLWTFGVRLEHNSNPICVTNCFSNLSTTFASEPTATTTAYNTLISANQHQAFQSQQPIAIDPRFEFAWQPLGVGAKTTVRGGFGIFTDSFPAEIASDLLANPPDVVRFTILGAAFGNNYTAQPSLTSSAGYAATTSNTAFQTAFPAGGSYSSISTATSGSFRRPAFNATTPRVTIPTTEIWSLALEQQIDNKTTVSATYVGNHSYHGAVTSWPNGYKSSGFTGLPTAVPNGSFGTTTLYYNANRGSYDGVVITGKRHDKYLLVELNYQFQKAIDLASNGGFNAFGNNPIGIQNPANPLLNKGLADYSIKHNLTGEYVVTVPYWGGPKVVTGGWQIAGTFFHQSGLPFSAVDTATVPSYYGGTLFATQSTNNFSHLCGGTKYAGVNAIQCPYAASGKFSSAANFGTQHRNTLIGPSYTDTDLTLTKEFAIPYHEAKLKIGAQFFNLLNKVNLAPPDDSVADGGAFGTITSAVSTPTSILGSFLGGDASPRLIQLTGKLSF
jgi:hypothetical protein